MDTSTASGHEIPSAKPTRDQSWLGGHIDDYPFIDSEWSASPELDLVLSQVSSRDLGYPIFRTYADLGHRSICGITAAEERI